MTDRSFEERNARATDELRRLVGTLSREDLATGVGGTWTVATASPTSRSGIAGRPPAGETRWRRGWPSRPRGLRQRPGPRERGAVEPTWRALPGEIAAALALERRGRASTRWSSRCRTRPSPRHPPPAGSASLDRAIHRFEHVAQVRRGLGRAEAEGPGSITGRNLRNAMRLVDSHCHLQAEPFASDADQVIGAARRAGVERILVPGWDEASSVGALELVGRFPGLSGVAVGRPPARRGRDGPRPRGPGSQPWRGAAGRRDRRDRARLRPDVLAGRVPAREPARATSRLRSRPASRRSFTAARGPANADAQDALVDELVAAGFDARGAGGVRGSTAGDPPLGLGPGRLRRGRRRARVRRERVGARVPARRGGDGRRRAPRVRPTGCSSRPTRRTSRRRARRAAATSPPGWASRRTGSQSIATRIPTSSASGWSRTTTGYSGAGPPERRVSAAGVASEASSRRPAACPARPG